MVEVTGAAQRAAWLANTPPPVEQVRPGLWSIPVPLPSNPLRYVLVYAFGLPDGIAIVDAGWDTPEAWSALVDGLAVAGYTIGDVRAALITHVHPDHYGLAGRVRAESGAWIGLHRLEAETLPHRYGDAAARAAGAAAVADVLVARSVEWLLRCGAEEAEARRLAGSSRQLLPFVHMAEPDRLIEDGERLKLPGWELRAIWTPGHTPGHLCFAEERTGVFLSGDHVLPRISPNVSLHLAQAPDPLRAFLESLAAVAALDVDEVLPGHEYRFRGLAERAEELRAHHEERLTELLSLVESHPGSTTWELSEKLSWRRPWAQIRDFHRRAAVGETLAHLALLASRGLVEPTAEPPDRWTARSGGAQASGW
jgi:glyoxylase-like metal-dependent hydrolase (beta-lactamase superfamily II)